MLSLTTEQSINDFYTCRNPILFLKCSSPPNSSLTLAPACIEVQNWKPLITQHSQNMHNRQQNAKWYSHSMLPSQFFFFLNQFQLFNSACTCFKLSLKKKRGSCFFNSKKKKLKNKKFPSNYFNNDKNFRIYNYNS